MSGSGEIEFTGYHQDRRRFYSHSIVLGGLLLMS